MHTGGTVENHRFEFQHAWSTRAAILILTAGAIWSTLLAWSLAPGGLQIAVTMLPLAISLFGAYRFYLTLRTVRVTADAIELVHPWGTRVVRLADVKGLRFDSYPHDLVVKTESREFRLPRTVQGFRNLHELVIEKTHQAEHEQFPVEVRVRRSVRFVSLFVVTNQALLGYFLIGYGFGVLFSALLVASLLVATFIFLDQYFLRRCVFQADGLWVHGLLGKKFFPHASLSETEVKKTTLWSRLQLHFGTQTVTLEDRVMDLPVVRLARIVEREWGHGVHGMQVPKKEAA
jgi:hypothetical protein